MNKEGNRHGKYVENTRYCRVWEQMQLLGIQDVTTNRQHKNGTVVWRLPIKNWNSGKTNIEVASFSTGYVRNQNSGYSNYQLNKRCQSEPEYFKLSNGDYRKFETRGCKLIPVEIDRLEYLIKYCVKNYYIKNANQVPNGDFVPKWRLDNAIEDRDNQAWRDKVKFLEQEVMDITEYRDLHLDERIKLEEKLDAMTEDRDQNVDRTIKLEEKVNDLQNTLHRIKTLADYDKPF